MDAMTLERATEFMRLVDNGQISGRISEWPGLRQACGVVYAHLAQPAQAVDVTDAMVARARAAFIKELKRGRYCGETSDGEHDRAMKAALTRALSVQKAGPVGDGWQPTDDDVRAWMGRNDITELSLYDCRTAIEDARIMHNFDVSPASPTPDKEGEG